MATNTVEAQNPSTANTSSTTQADIPDGTGGASNIAGIVQRQLAQIAQMLKEAFDPETKYNRINKDLRASEFNQFVYARDDGLDSNAIVKDLVDRALNGEAGALTEQDWTALTTVYEKLSGKSTGEGNRLDASQLNELYESLWKAPSKKATDALNLLKDSGYGDFTIDQVRQKLLDAANDPGLLKSDRETAAIVRAFNGQNPATRPNNGSGNSAPTATDLLNAQKVANDVSPEANKAISDLKLKQLESEGTQGISRNHRISHLAVQGIVAGYLTISKDNPETAAALKPQIVKYLTEVSGRPEGLITALLDQAETAAKGGPKAAESAVQTLVTAVADPAYNVRFGDGTKNGRIGEYFDPNQTADGSATPRTDALTNLMESLTEEVNKLSNDPAHADAKGHLQTLQRFLIGNIDVYKRFANSTVNGSSTAQEHDPAVGTPPAPAPGEPEPDDFVSGFVPQDPVDGSGTTSGGAPAPAPGAPPSGSTDRGTPPSNDGSSRPGGGRDGEASTDTSFADDPALDDVSGGYSNGTVIATGDSQEGLLEFASGIVTNYSAGTDSGTTEDGTQYSSGAGEASAFVGVEVSHTVTGENGEVTVYLKSGVDAEASGGYHVSKNPETGEFELIAFGRVGVELFEAGVSGEWGTANDEITLRGGVNVRVGTEAGTSLQVNNTYVSGELEAFAGAEFSTSAGASFLDDTVQVDGEVGALVGVGIGAGGHAGIDDGHLKLGFSFKIALGLGIKVDLKLDIDLNKVKDVATEVANAISDALSKAGIVVGDALKDFAGTVANGIKEFGTAFVDGLKNFGEDFYNGVKQYGKAAFDAISQFGQDAVNAIRDFGQDALNAIRDFGQDALNAIRDTGRAAIDFIANLGSKAIDALRKGGAEAVEIFLKGGAEAIDLFMGFAGTAAEFLANGLEKGWDWYVNAASAGRVDDEGELIWNLQG
jgi:hypothetical protein